MTAEHAKEHAKKAAKADGDRPLAPPSPRNGNRLPLSRKGETSNPAGSSAKQRMKAAFEAVLAEMDPKDVVRCAMRIGSNEESPLAITAAKWLWDRGVGPVAEVAEGKLTVTTRIELADRDGGTPPPERAPIEISVEHNCAPRPSDDE